MNQRFLRFLMLFAILKWFGARLIAKGNIQFESTTCISSTSAQKCFSHAHFSLYLSILHTRNIFSNYFRNFLSKGVKGSSRIFSVGYGKSIIKLRMSKCCLTNFLKHVLKKLIMISMLLISKNPSNL